MSAQQKKIIQAARKIALQPEEYIDDPSLTAPIPFLSKHPDKLDIVTIDVAHLRARCTVWRVRSFKSHIWRPSPCAPIFRPIDVAILSLICTNCVGSYQLTQKPLYDSLFI